MNGSKETPTTLHGRVLARRCSRRSRESFGIFTPRRAWHNGGIVFESTSPQTEKLTGIAPRRSFSRRDVRHGPEMPARPRSVIVVAAGAAAVRGDAVALPDSDAPTAEARARETTTVMTARPRCTARIVATRYLRCEEVVTVRLTGL